MLLYQAKAKNSRKMAALVDPTGLYSAVVADLYTQGRNALLDVINLERNGEELNEGYLNDLLSLVREVLGRYDNASTPPVVLRMLEDLCSFVEDMSERVSRKQSRNPLQRWRAAQRIKDARKKLEQFLHKVNLICLLLYGQDMGVVSKRLDGISTQILTLGTHQSQQLASSPPIGISKETSTISSADTLTNSNLSAGQSLQSKNGCYQFVMQDDGNLVLYRVSDHHALWASCTNGEANGCFLAMQGDGNLVIYSNQKVAVWSSRTYRSLDRYSLIMQNDGNVVIYTLSHVPIWVTNTVQ